MIGTFCRSCRTISPAFKDRCGYCGSQHTEIKSVSNEQIHNRSKGRQIVEEQDGKRKAYTQIKEA